MRKQVKTIMFEKDGKHMMQKSYGKENHELVIKMMMACGWKVIRVLG